MCINKINLTQFILSKINLSPHPCGCPLKGVGSVVDDSLFIVTPIDFVFCVGPYFTMVHNALLSVLSIAAILLMKRELVILLYL